ncbi:MAG: hydantoinase B/oxoprolinase family protein [Mariniblastus sp.]|nr:hydantoinase B/oxoprolinase family protein [Mariniblastus sp.]
MTDRKYSNAAPRWAFWVDVGGTFTDCLAESPDGNQRFIKVLSSATMKGVLAEPTGRDRFQDADHQNRRVGFWNGVGVRFLDASGELVGQSEITHFEEGEFTYDARNVPSLAAGTRYELRPKISAPLLAMHCLMNLPLNAALPDCDLHLGTTRGTNALLTRSGARTALITTCGFKDLLVIGDQARPRLFELDIDKPEPLFEKVIEIDERVLADGTVERAPDRVAVKRQLQTLRESGIESVAICFMHSYRWPAHENQVAQIAADLGFESVRVSSEVAPSIKIVPRAETSVLDAYLNPVIVSYLEEIRSRLTHQSRLRLMTSAGGLVSPKRFSGKDSVLSGPAGGVVGAARIAGQLGYSRAIGFDMGGTSTDVSRYDGCFEHEYQSRKAGVRIVSPMLGVETVAAGGGSICWFDGKRMQVGPASAGADPGPACYGGGGPLTITDINLYLKRIAHFDFPLPLDFAAVQVRLEEIRGKVVGAGFKLTLQELAEGFLDIANNNMASAIRSISVSKGYDPSDYLLVSFGGAGSQHCCAVADKLNIHRILDHPQSSVLSAVGIQLADQTAFASESVLKPLRKINVLPFGNLRELVIQKLVGDGNPRDSIVCKNQLDLRYRGTDPCLTIDQPEDGDFLACFELAHQRLYGYLRDESVEIVTARVEGVTLGERPAEVSPLPRRRALEPAPGSERVIPFSDISPGDLIEGPVMIVDQFKTTLIDPGWCAVAQANGSLLLERTEVAAPRTQPIVRASEMPVNPIQLEIFSSHFAAIAKQMGIVLQKTSTSVNVKERLDFSCAVFTRQGDLVVNAPHIPVHLGAMSETVRSIIRMNPEVKSGDVFLTNDPYAGGSHLPDVTTVTPVFEPSNKELVFWVASRSHHAEIGGKAPGSMPADATRLGEEGVLIQNFKLIDAGQERFDILRQHLTRSPYPSRSPEENIGDITAQVAANRRGQTDLLDLVDRYSRVQVERYMRFMQEAAAVKVQTALASQFTPGTYQFQDAMDSGAKIQVTIQWNAGRLAIDFEGTDPVCCDNLNANRAIVTAAVMYVMRCLIDEDIPLNEGVMSPVDLRLPVCFLNPRPAADPSQSPAVVGGNVETSQRIVDVLLGALGIAAASQGTMNNWLMGDDSFGYYETVCGGSGATGQADGADGVHTHMTNTRLTDPEVLESRYPAVLRDFSIRLNSGGNGRYRGGCGIRREIEFRQPLTLSLLTSRRNTRPFGLCGGSAGEPGVNQFSSTAGERRDLPSQCEVKVTKGDRLVLLTPGGGGFGDAKSGVKHPDHSDRPENDQFPGESLER